jgi:hypothetical protein
MKTAIAGFAVGIVLSILLVVIAMSGGERFRSMVLKYGVENGTGIIATERFVVLFDGVDEGDAGSSMITYAGRHGSLPALWSGYSSGWGAGDKGITSLHTYDPNKGRALLCWFGKLILVEESGRFLRVQNGRFALEDEVIIVSVGEDGLCKSLTDDEARGIYEALDPRYKDGVVSARPPRVQANRSTRGDVKVAAPQSQRSIRGK